jgi:outer membrane protein assembly factor BamE (lipoprotein component of BamABCDE complex)
MTAAELKAECSKMSTFPARFNMILTTWPMHHWRVRSLWPLASACCAAATGAAILAGCATVVEQRGNLPPQEKLAEIQPGATSKDEVIRILGSPSSVGIFNDRSWYYISRRTGQFAFFEPDVIDQQVYIINFDDQGIVKTVDHKGVQDAKAIDPVPRATPAPGRELTFFEQLIGNVGKFNTAGSSRTGTSGPTGRPPS